MIRILLSMLFTAVYILSIQKGVAWIHDGYGLHPAIAFPLAAFSVVGLLVTGLIAIHVDARRSKQ